MDLEENHHRLRDGRYDGPQSPTCRQVPLPPLGYGQIAEHIDLDRHYKDMAAKTSGIFKFQGLQACATPLEQTSPTLEWNESTSFHFTGRGSLAKYTQERGNCFYSGTGQETAQNVFEHAPKKNSTIHTKKRLGVVEDVSPIEPSRIVDRTMNV